MNYHNITYPDMNNGDGLRVVLWLSGCSHHCYNCQNPQTWDANSGIPFDESAKKELFRELDMDICPKCGSKNLTKIDRMNGYLSYSRVHGDTRLNDAKMAEIADRKSM